jgi:hypothetical protein
MPSASWDVLLVRMVPVKYETPRCIFDCWLPKIHKVNADSSPTALRQVHRPSSNMVGYSLPLLIFVWLQAFRDLGCTFGTYGSREVEMLPCIFDCWLPTIHKVNTDSSPTSIASVQQRVRVYVNTMFFMWLHAVTSWNVLSVRMVPVKYETPHCRFDCWIHKIHEVNTESSHTSSTPVQQLGRVQLTTIM